MIINSNHRKLVTQCVLFLHVHSRTVVKTSDMAGNYRQDEYGFYYAESAAYNPPGYEFSAPGNEFPADP